MGMTKNYLLGVLHACTDKQFGQDAIEWAILNGRIQLTGHLKTDVRLIMGTVPDGQPGETHYDRIITAYRQAMADHTEALAAVYESSGLMEEILRPVSLAASQATVILEGKPLVVT